MRKFLFLVLFSWTLTSAAIGQQGHGVGTVGIAEVGGILEITIPIQITFGAGETMNLARATNDTLWFYPADGNAIRYENNNVDVFTVADDGITTILSTANGATEILLITVDPATPANNDEAQLAFRLDPSGAGAVRTFGRVDVALLDITDGAETAAWGADVWDSDGAGTMIEGINIIGRTGQDEVVINEGSVDLDFRIESDGNVNAFFLQSSSGFAGFGTNDPDRTLHILGTTSVTQIIIQSPGTTNLGALAFGDDDANSAGLIEYNHQANKFTMNTGGVGRLVLGSTGLRLGVGVAEGGTNFQIDGNTANAAHPFFTLNNDDEQATGETGQTVDMIFEVQGTVDSGTAYTDQEAGKISIVKVSDYFTASGEADNDSRFEFSPVTNGSYVLALTLTDNDVIVADDVLLADGAVIGITGNEIITFNAAGTILLTGASWDVDGAATATSYVSDGLITATTILTGAEIGNTAQQTTTLGSSVATFAVTSNIIQLTGDGGANSVTTITGAEIGLYTIIFVDALVTLVDDDTHTADTLDLAGGNIVGADDKLIILGYDGTSWYQAAPASTN